MHIMLMAQCYAPEEVSAAVLITELATDLVKKEHQVTMITAAPSYPYGRLYPGYRNRLYQVEWLDRVRVVRTWSYISPHKTFWHRFLSYCSYSIAAFFGGLLVGKPDILVSFSPPFPLSLSACLLSRFWRIPWVLQLEDLYPDAAVAAGVLSNRSAVALFSFMEHFFYRCATHISLISESFRRNLIAKGVSPEKMTLIPVWADPDLVRPMPKENAFRSQHGLLRKFVVIYAGNLGLTSSLEDALAAAELLRAEPDICFVMVGEGVKKPVLEEMAKRNSLENIIFLPYQPRDVFPEVLAAADLGLVTLNRSSSNFSLPSKIFNVMASARPILGITPLESELAQMIDETECGVAIPPERSELLAEVILELKQQDKRLTKMGQNGRHQLETKFARAVCVGTYNNMLMSLVENDT